MTPLPYHSTDVDDWLVAADAISEEGDPWRWRKALRIAEGLRRNRGMQLVLVSQEIITREDGISTLGPTGALLPPPHQRLAMLAEADWRIDEYDPERWRTSRWLTMHGYNMIQRYSWDVPSCPQGNCPADFPRLIERAPALADAYFMRRSAGLTVTLRNGVPWLRVTVKRKKSRHWPREKPTWRPYFQG